MDVFECKYEIGYEMVNDTGKMKPRSLVELFMETAVKNCLSVGYSVFDMLKDNLGWILRGGEYVVSRMPIYAEKIRIRTWVSKWSLFQGVREFVILDEKGDRIVNCSSVWAMIDLLKRIPSKVADIFRNKWNFNESKATDSLLIKRPFDLTDVVSRKDFKVLRRDMDSNMHVHNLSYIDWVFETLPPQCIQGNISNMSGAFLKEISGVDAVRCIVGKDSAGNFVHNITSLDESTVYATGRTVWNA